MFTVKSDVEKNRLYITLVGFFHQDEMKACTDTTIAEIKKLKPGFDVVTDVSQFKPVGQEALDEVARGQAFFKSAGIRHGIRIEGDAVLSSNQFSRVGKAVDYNPNIVKTVADADKLLDSYSRN